MSVLVVVQQSKRSDKNSMFGVCIFVFESLKVEEFIVKTMNHTEMRGKARYEVFPFTLMTCKILFF